MLVFFEVITPVLYATPAPPCIAMRNRVGIAVAAFIPRIEELIESASFAL
jgi:hypothetical protein